MKDVYKRSLQVVSQLIIIMLILFVSAGQLDWKWAWSYFIISILVLIINAIVLPKELISERGKKKENVKKWDRIITGLNFIPVIGILIISGLDFRFKWSPEINIWLHISGVILFVIGNMLFTWSMVSNKFFSTLVRIQSERNHTVAEKGPYKYIRHPGYLGFIIFNASTPLLLGTFWALIPTTIVILLFIVRTHLEDKTLKVELRGYKEYAEKVKYRLIPGIY
jgi:protein-S-isoprenylcysteine O-methyltransferase Ste14